MKKESPLLGQAAVLISGGIDSFACAHLLKAQGSKVRGIFIDYGQAAATAERAAVRKVTDYLEIPLVEFNAGGQIVFGEGELVGRNAFLISAAIFLGMVHDGLLAIGVHAGTRYYDCSPAFIEKMKRLSEEQTEGQLTIIAPFADWTKTQVHEYATSVGLPLQSTYSCEAGTVPPCSTCSSCCDRRALGC